MQYENVKEEFAMARFTLPRDLYHGKGALEALKTFKGKKAIICVGGGSMKRFGFLDRAVSYLEEAGMEVRLFEGIEPDPSVETVMKGAAAMQEFEPDWIVAMGGGSPIDAAKAMWIKYEYPDITFEEMCKVFGIPALRQKANFCAISSTSGTATEVTAFSIITDYEKGIKYPIADFEITPDVAIVDPELAETMPKKLVAHTGMDAITHAIEAYVSTAASPFSDAMAEKAMELIGGNIRRFVARRTDLEAAEAMLTGSLFAGIAFSFARLGNVHAMSHPVSAFFNVAHGVANAVLLPVIAEYNALADQGRYLKIYNYISPIPAYEDEFEPLMLVDAIRELNEDIGIPEDLTTAIRQAKKGEKLSDEEIESKIDAMADDAMKSGNIAVNPRSSRKQDIVELYHKAL